MTPELIRTFEEIRQYLIRNPSPDFIPLMLNAFGNGSGLGVYQVCDDVFRPFSKREMVPHLAAALLSRHWGVRYWAAHWAMDFPHESLVSALADLAQDPHSDCHYFAIAALEAIWRETGSQAALQAIANQEDQQTDPEVLELIAEILDDAEQESSD